MRISDWSSDVCSSDLRCTAEHEHVGVAVIAEIAVEIVPQHAGLAIGAANHHQRAAGRGERRDCSVKDFLVAVAATVRFVEQERYLVDHKRADCQDRKSTRLNSSH